MKEARQYNNIDEYINMFSKEEQAKLKQLRSIIKENAPDAVETISYQMPTFKLKQNLVHFAMYKNHIGFYPTPSAIIAFKKELTKYQTSKGAIQFPLNEEIPIDLIKRIVIFRVEEVKKLT